MAHRHKCRSGRDAEFPSVSCGRIHGTYVPFWPLAWCPPDSWSLRSLRPGQRLVYGDHLGHSSPRGLVGPLRGSIFPIFSGGALWALHVSDPLGDGPRQRSTSTSSCLKPSGAPQKWQSPQSRPMAAKLKLRSHQRHEEHLVVRITSPPCLWCRRGRRGCRRRKVHRLRP